MNKIIPLALGVVMPIIGIITLYTLFGGMRDEAVREKVRQSQNPSTLMFMINDRESEIRRLELERIRVQAITDTEFKSIATGHVMKVENPGELMGDRNYNKSDIEQHADTIKTRLYGSWWRNIYPECSGWNHTEWMAYIERWDKRKSDAKGVEWAREVETNGWFKEGYYPYEEGAYMKLARLNDELAKLRSLDNGMRESATPPGNPSARFDPSLGAP